MVGAAGGAACNRDVHCGVASAAPAGKRTGRLGGQSQLAKLCGMKGHGLGAPACCMVAQDGFDGCCLAGQVAMPPVWGMWARWAWEVCVLGGYGKTAQAIHGITVENEQGRAAQHPGCTTKERGRTRGGAPTNPKGTGRDESWRSMPRSSAKGTQQAWQEQQTYELHATPGAAHAVAAALQPATRARLGSAGGAAALEARPVLKPSQQRRAGCLLARGALHQSSAVSTAVQSPRPRACR